MEDDPWATSAVQPRFGLHVDEARAELEPVIELFAGRYITGEMHTMSYAQAVYVKQ